jgi:hypothetical protein
MRRWSQALKKRNTPLEISDPIPIPQFETRVAATPRGSGRLSYKGKPLLDYYAHRDIVDELLYHLPYRDLLRWRETCSELHTKLDLSRLSLRIRPINSSTRSCLPFCLMEVCTAGGILIGGWSCRVSTECFQ